MERRDDYCRVASRQRHAESRAVLRTDSTFRPPQPCPPALPRAHVNSYPYDNQDPNPHPHAYANPHAHHNQDSNPHAHAHANSYPDDN
jgi:hypothetical protein